MAYRVLLQREYNGPYVDTGVIETNPDQRANWEDICTHMGYAGVWFVAIEENYRLVVPKRCYRKRQKKAA